MKKIGILFSLLLLYIVLNPSKTYAAACGEMGDCSTLQCPSNCPSKTVTNYPSPQCECVYRAKPILEIGGKPVTSPVTYSNLGEIISNLLPYVFVFSGIILFALLVMKGFEFLTSRGDPKKVESAKTGITAALVGFIIIFISYWAMQILEVVFNISVLK